MSKKKTKPADRSSVSHYDFNALNGETPTQLDEMEREKTEIIDEERITDENSVDSIEEVTQDTILDEEPQSPQDDQESEEIKTEDVPEEIQVKKKEAKPVMIFEKVVEDRPTEKMKYTYYDYIILKKDHENLNEKIDKIKKVIDAPFKLIHDGKNILVGPFEDKNQYARIFRRLQGIALRPESIKKAKFLKGEIDGEN